MNRRRIALVGVIATTLGLGTAFGVRQINLPRPAGPASGNTIAFTSDQSIVLTKAGQTFQFTAVLENASHQVQPGQLQWSSDTPNQVDVSASGKVTAKTDLGSANIMVTSPGVADQAAQVTIATPAPNTVIVASGSVLALRAKSATLALTSATRGIVAGDTLVSGNRGGLLFKVLSVAIAQQTMVVTIAPASLLSAFTHLSIDAESPLMQVALSNTALATTQAASAASNGQLLAALVGTGATPGAVTREPGSSSPTAQSSGHPVLLNKGSQTLCTNQAGIGSSIKLTGTHASVNATVRLIAKVNIDPLFVELAVRATVPVKVSAGTMQISASGREDAECTVNLFSHNLATFNLPDPIFLTVIQINGVVSAKAGVGFSGSASAGFSLTGPTVTTTVTGEDGIEYSRGKWSPLADNSSHKPTMQPPDAKFSAELSGAFTASAQIDFGVSASAGFGLGPWCALCSKVAQADLAFAKATGTLNFQIASPFDPLESAYTGPIWNADLEVAAGPEISFSGPLVDLLSRIGVQLPNQHWNLFDLKVPLTRSPEITGAVSDTTLTGETLTAVVTPGYVGDTVEFVAYPNASVLGRVVASANVGADNSATTWWMVPSDGRAAYTVVALLAAAPFGSTLPYASAAGNGASLVAVVLGNGSVSLYSQTGKLLGHELMSVAAPGPDGVYFVNGSTLSRINEDGTTQQVQTNLPIPSASDPSEEFLGPVISPDGTQWLYGTESVDYNQPGNPTTTDLYIGSMGQPPRRVAHLERDGAGFRPTEWGNAGVILAFDSRLGGGGPGTPFFDQASEYNSEVILNPSTGGISSPVGSTCAFGVISSSGALACVISDIHGYSAIQITQRNGSVTRIALPKNDGVGAVQFTPDGHQITFAAARCWSGGCGAGYSESSYSAPTGGGIARLEAANAVITGFLPNGSILTMGCVSESATAVREYETGPDGRIGVLNSTTGVITPVVFVIRASAPASALLAYPVWDAWVIPSNGPGSNDPFAGPCF